MEDGPYFVIETAESKYGLRYLYLGNSRKIKYGGCAIFVS